MRRIAIDGCGRTARDARAAICTHPAFCANGGLELVIVATRDGAAGEATPAWGKHGVDIVLDCSGGDPRRHLAAGATKVLRGAPAGGFAFDGMVVFGVNHMRIDGSHRLLHGACSATHGIAPVARLLHYAVGIEHAVITPMHDARLGAGIAFERAGSVAAQLQQVLPRLPGALDETPPVHVPDCDLVLLGMVFAAGRETSVEEVNALIQCASFGAYDDLLRYCDGPVAGRSGAADMHSCLFQAALTQVSGRIVKVCAGYRSELGYARRLVDTLEVMARV
ncbi:MAG: aldehyde dehydrogenase [Pseudomonadota bacterium]